MDMGKEILPRSVRHVLEHDIDDNMARGRTGQLLDPAPVATYHRITAIQSDPCAQALPSNQEIAGGCRSRR